MYDVAVVVQKKAKALEDVAFNRMAHFFAVSLGFVFMNFGIAMFFLVTERYSVSLGAAFALSVFVSAASAYFGRSVVKAWNEWKYADVAVAKERDKTRLFLLTGKRGKA